MKEFLAKFVWRIALVLDRCFGDPVLESTVLDVMLGLVNLFIVAFILAIFVRILQRLFKSLKAKLSDFLQRSKGKSRK